jgi:hypothetical protein
MRSACKMRRTRLVSAVATLALVFASTIGAFGHAVSHCHHAVAVDAPDVHAVEASVTAAHPEPDQTGYEDGNDNPCQPHSNCCDTFCHGGQAILTVPPILSPPPPATSPVSRPDLTDRGAPACIERPPRFFVLV